MNENIQVPEILTGNKSATLNGTGYIFFVITPVGHSFIKNEAHPDKSVLEIGCGYNNIVIEALQKGVGSYTANDISEEHLKILRARVNQFFGQNALTKLKHLHFLTAKAPTELPVAIEQYDAILADKVIHFMTPDEITQFISWSKKALKKEGKLYVVTASPYSKTYKKMLPQYLENLARGDKFPGHIKNIMSNLDQTVMQNYPQYKVPDEMVLFSRSDLINLFQREGMEVTESYSLKIPTEGENTWSLINDKESNVVGVVAKKI